MYDRPFWRDEGLTGTAVSTTGPVTRDVRRLAARRAQQGSGDHLRLRRRRRRTQLQRDVARAARRAAVLEQFATFFGSQALKRHGLLRDELVGRGVDPGLPGRDPQHWHAARLRALAAGARRPDPLGGHRDLELLERLHGRRRALRRASRSRGARGAVSAVTACAGARLAGLRARPSCWRRRGLLAGAGRAGAGADRRHAADAERVPVRRAPRPRSRGRRGRSPARAPANAHRCWGSRWRSRTTPTSPGETTAFGCAGRVRAQGAGRGGRPPAEGRRAR